MMTKSACELLLPVGNMKMCLAAIHNGADAIYVGVPEFNARGRSVDHSISDLKEMIELCHLYGVKVNLAFNVVIFEEEILEVINLLRIVLPLNPDAIIVQDLGLVQIIRQMNPDQIIHASTQMTVTNHEAMTLLDDLKIKRFVLGREVSIKEISAIREKSNKELEVFVHGALCVAYSGQCFTSESIGGRSANRGQCAQSCRFEYDLIVDGKKKQMADIKYLVSPKDLCGITQIPSLCDLNVNSFKVEGRLKTPEYVASAARSYRMAIDSYFKNKKLSDQQIEKFQNEMGLTYSRGFFTGWLNGVDHQNLVKGTYGAHRGNFIGEILKILPKSIIIKSHQKCKNGDGLMFASKNITPKIEFGGKIFEIKALKNQDEYEVNLGREFVLSKLRVGFEVYFNSDPVLANELTKSYEDKNNKKRIPILITVNAKIGEALHVLVKDKDNNEIQIKSDAIVEKALNNPTTSENIKNELSSLGSTIFKINNFEFFGDKNIFIHQKELKNIRRRFTEDLMKKRIHRHQSQIFDFKYSPYFNLTSDKKCRLNILLREFSQIQFLLSFVDGIRDILGIVYLDYEFGKEYKESVEILKSNKIEVGIATTRILKPNEYHNFKIIERANPDYILIRNLGALQYFQDKNFKLRGDFSLNVTNSLTLNYLISKNCETVCASYDLNQDRLINLLKNSPKGTLEVTIHQYMPSFHMEHCVFAAFLSKGHSFRDCGKPCEKHRVELLDQFGNRHFIKADQECRNTMFNEQAQSAAMKINSWKKMGLTEFRFEALYENAEELKTKILNYSELIRMNADMEESQYSHIFKQIGAIEKYGLGEGALARESDFKDRKKEKL